MKRRELDVRRLCASELSIANTHLLYGEYTYYRWLHDRRGGRSYKPGDVREIFYHSLL